MVTLYHSSVMASTSIDDMRKSGVDANGSTFGAWLSREIKSQGMSQGEFARRVGVSATTVSRWVNGRVPDGQFIERIADVLLLDADEVLTRSGYRPPDSELDPDSPEGRIIALVKRIHWTDRDAEIIEAQLRLMIEIERRRRKR